MNLAQTDVFQSTEIVDSWVTGSLPWYNGGEVITGQLHYLIVIYLADIIRGRT